MISYQSLLLSTTVLNDYYQLAILFSNSSTFYLPKYALILIIKKGLFCDTKVAT